MSMYDMFHQAMNWGISNRVDDWLTDRVKEMRAREAMPYEHGNRVAPKIINPMTDAEKIAALIDEVTALRAKYVTSDRLEAEFQYFALRFQGQSWLARYLRRVLRGEK